MMATTETLGQTVSLAVACSALNVPRSTLYRARAPRSEATARPTPQPALRRALSPAEKATVRTTLNSARFQDCAPREVYGALLEDETYLCSVPTMYRILRANDEVRERRDQLRHPAYTKPELLATAPNQVWTWDTLAPAQVQVLPSCLGRPNGFIFTCTSCWTCTAAKWSAGCWPVVKPPNWPSSW